MGAKINIIPPYIHPRINNGQNNKGNEKANGDSALSNFFDISDILILPKISYNLITSIKKKINCHYKRCI